MKKVLILRGLPVSGKSSYAKKLVDKGGYKRVSKDDLRAMLDNSKWSKKNEEMVLRMRDYIIIDSLSDGVTPIVDDTNFSTKHINHIKEMVRGIAEIEIKDFDVPVEECIKRDLQRPNSVGSKVIMDMYNKYVRKKEKYNGKGFRKAIICDIDGTLAIMGTRSPYDFNLVYLDTPNQPVRKVVNMLSKEVEIIIVSGRDEECRDDTEKWLSDNKIKYNLLYMRKKGDRRKDSIIKKELFDEHIRGKYDIDIVLDDRDQVIDMWRNELGLPTWQVNEGDF